MVQRQHQASGQTRVSGIKRSFGLTVHSARELSVRADEQLASSSVVRCRASRKDEIVLDKYNTCQGPRVLQNFSARAGLHSVTRDPFFLSVQRSGFRLEWKDGKEPFQGGFRRCSLEKEKAEAFHVEHVRLTKEVQCTRFVRSADTPPSENEYVHPVFAIHQATKWRSIYNLKKMNPSLVERRFKMTGVATWKGMILQNMYMCSIDIKDAYLHIMVAEDSRRFMRYEWQNSVWELTALPFGLSQAPWVFTRMLKPLLQGWRLRLGISIIAWLDDIILGAQSKSHLKWALQEILDDLSRVGLTVNSKPGKSYLSPTRRLKWCGILWDSKAMMCYVPTERRNNVMKAAAKLLRRARKGPVLARELAIVTGKIQATAEAILPQRAYSMALVRELGRLLRRTHSYESTVRLSEKAMTQLEWWKTQMPEWNGRSWAGELPAAVVMTTDASPLAWGAILEVFQAALVRPLAFKDLPASCHIIEYQHGQDHQPMRPLGGPEVNSPGGLDLENSTNPKMTLLGNDSERPALRSETSGYFSPMEALRNQNEREALAVQFAMKAFNETLRAIQALQLPGSLLKVKILQDNIAVVQTIRKMGSTKAGLGEVLEESMREAFEQGMHMQAAWIAGKDMEADPLSRELALLDSSDWAVAPATFSRICNYLQVFPEIDLFASRINRKVTTFYSMTPDPEALDFDSLSSEKNWASFSLCYAAPPQKLIPKVFRKIISDEATVLVFVPKWLTAPWWATLEILRRGRPMVEVKLTRHSIIRGTGINPLQWAGGTAVAVVLSNQAEGHLTARTGGRW